MSEQIFDEIDGSKAYSANRAILCGVAFQNGEYDSSDEVSMDELESLLDTAGGQAVARVVQNRPVPEAATFIGRGKAEEVSRLVEDLDCGMVVFDNDLSSSQIRNLEQITGARVIDRSMLILDIFAMRAQTREGKLQVELAQLKYTMPRLTATAGELSRLGGGIGTRGPGESKLETDRRHVKTKIQYIEGELSEIAKNRETQRKSRLKNKIPIVAIIGYTNAGKSTLFNLLTGENVLVEDKLFATLDPVTRKIVTRNGLELIISDTVGFVRKLPHHLVKAFKSTLEEMVYADIIIHVIDASNPYWRECQKVAYDLMRELGAEKKPTITVYNKCDNADISMIARQDDTVFISALNGAGVDDMLSLIENKLNELKRTAKLMIPYNASSNVDLLHKQAEVISLEYGNDGINIVVRMDAETYGRFKEYIVDSGEIIGGSI